MKTLLSIGLLFVCLQTTAQWSNTTNEFYDSLHTPVSLVAGDEQNPLVLKSYPDSGYFVIWLDSRNNAATKTDIYAQKYDKNGNRLWGENGKPVTVAAGNQTYAFSSNQDYRSRSFAATDSSGGFYICYTDDNAYYPRVVVQHMTGNGSAVFSEPGFIAASTTEGQGYFLQTPLLIPDGKKGFFISYVQNNGYTLNYIHVYDYHDENGVMKRNGGYIVNGNISQKYRQGPCHIEAYVDSTTAAVTDYNIWPDLQGGCNIIMNMNNGSNVLAFNRVFRAKANAKVPVVSRNIDGIACTEFMNYKADSLYKLYNIGIDDMVNYCDPQDGHSSIVSYHYTTVRSFGYRVLAIGAYDYYYAKGITLPASDKININMIAYTQRDYVNNKVGNPTVQGYAYEVENFNSIPYEVGASRSIDSININGVPTQVPPLKNFSTFRDTLLASDTYTAYPDFSFAAGGNVIYAAALLNSSANTGGTRQVKLQALTLQKATSSSGVDSFYLSYNYKAPKAGLAIGSESYTGGSNGIAYEFPRLDVTPSGNALFSIYDQGRSTRVSPIEGTRLTWGAMGRHIGTGIDKKAYYGNDLPVVALDPDNATGIVAWRDTRTTSAAPNTGINIFMRHLDELNTFNYTPPVRPVRIIPNSFTGISEANPLILYGTSEATTPIEFSSIYFNPSTAILATIKDNNNIGRLQTSIYQNTGAVRRYNNTPYLDRNLTFGAENTPADMSADIALYFTKAEFAALKAADTAIHSIDDLSVINQPLVPNTVPSAYTPVSDEIAINPYSSGSIESGYLLRFYTSRFGNFFIMKLPPLILCPGSSTTLTAGIKGFTYQWILNTDGGNFYTAIDDDSHFSGTKTSTLQLNNIPSSWSGYKFICQADGISSRTFTLQFANNWNGAVNGDWNNPANWSCGAIPDANTDVTINSGSVNVNTNAFCRTLKVEPGAGVSVSPGYALTVTK